MVEFVGTFHKCVFLPWPCKKKEYLQTLVTVLYGKYHVVLVLKLSQALSIVAPTTTAYGLLLRLAPRDY